MTQKAHVSTPGEDNEHVKLPISEVERRLVNERLRKRVLLLDKAEKDLELRAELLELCKRDPVFWINNFCWTYNPNYPSSCQDIPFELFPFQTFFVEEVVKCIRQKEDFAIEKSRDMGASWLLLMIMQWFWLFEPSVSFLLGSKKEYDVDTGGIDPQTLFGKLRYNLFRLPLWMRPAEFREEKTYSVYNKQMTMHNKEMNSFFKGQTGTKDFGRSGRYTAALFDELAYWDEGREGWNGCQQTTRCRMAISTPDGDGNMFYDAVHWPGRVVIQHPDAEKIAISKGLKAEGVPY